MTMSNLRKIIGCLALVIALLPYQAFAQSRGYTGDPLPFLTDSQRSTFDAGFELFVKIWTQEEGLGPEFNARSCTSCHRVPLPGGSGTTQDTLVPHSASFRDVVGGTTVARFSLSDSGELSQRKLPTITTNRRTPALFGIGLLEAIPEWRIRGIADPNDGDGNGISGRVVELTEEIGRFGWKGNISSIHDFVAVAFATELGLTSSQLRTDDPLSNLEISDDQIRAIANYIRLLSQSPPEKFGYPSEKGQLLFGQLGCHECHTPSHKTESDIGVLHDRTIYPYTDLLVHDMGADLADGLTEADVGPREFRTPPLWGVASTGPPYLHDGRAKSLKEAVEMHGGEAESSARLFKQLDVSDQNELIRFLKSL